MAREIALFRQQIYHTLIGILVAILSFLWAAQVAQAANVSQVATVLTIQPVGPLKLDEPLIVVARLTTVAGAPIPNKTVALALNGTSEQRARTDVAGTVSFHVRTRLTGGTYAITVTFGGTQTLAPAQASRKLVIEPAEPTVLTIQPVGRFALGAHPTVTAVLTTAGGQPLANQPLALMVDGAPKQRARTDSAGAAVFSVGGSQRAGKYQLSTVFEGSSTFLESRAMAELPIEPARLEIRTVPALPNVPFSLDGKIFKSDADGVARIAVSEPGSHHLQVLPSEAGEHVRVDFSRWGDSQFAPSREVKIPLTEQLEAGFNLSYQVSPTFTDHAGHAVAPERIASMTIKGSNGLRHTFVNIQPRWLQSSGVVLRWSGLEQNKVQYTVESVIIDGSNVVNPGESIFVLDPASQWRIALLLNPALFSARDALFDFPIGSGIHIEYPLGRTEDLEFGPQASVRVESLVAGRYRVNPTGAAVLSRITLVDLNSDQEVRLDVISYLDIAVVGLVIIAAVTLLLGGLILVWRFYGRHLVIAAMALMLSAQILLWRFHGYRRLRLARSHPYSPDIAGQSLTFEEQSRSSEASVQ
jgi:hypothetical protein